jgi:hypothetical protein
LKSQSKFQNLRLTFIIGEYCEIFFTYFLLFVISFVCSCSSETTRRETTKIEIPRLSFSFSSGERISIISCDIIYNILDTSATIVFKDLQDEQTHEEYLIVSDISHDKLSNFKNSRGPMIGFINKKRLYAHLLYSEGKMGIVFTYIPSITVTKIKSWVSNPDGCSDWLFDEFAFYYIGGKFYVKYKEDTGLSTSSEAIFK